ncbi:unnamed protein product [Pleuronectes platessa]|uniref:Uncharacterized protein n=1 Tax=Pleuronectes platessa TaxID=8262 RepID=A0A9N7Z5A6_PLEPL|nr:unnamed protein product [Pleuronectes platessa]
MSELHTNEPGCYAPAASVGFPASSPVSGPGPDAANLHLSILLMPLETIRGLDGVYILTATDGVVTSAGCKWSSRHRGRASGDAAPQWIRVLGRCRHGGCIGMWR